MADFDYYKELGVNEDASEADLKKAYRKLAMEYHPDKNPGNAEAEAKFKRVNESYETLKDSQKRSEYDTIRKFGGSGTGFRGAGGRDPFEDIFGRGGFHVHDPFDVFKNFDHTFRQATAKNRDINLNYQITLEDAYNGKEVEINFTLPGTKQNKNLKLNIPAGIDAGNRIKYAGQGDHSDKRLQSGDLYITIHIVQHSTFVRRSQHLILPLTVNALKAAIGTEVNIKTLDGAEIAVKVPAGTQHGTMLRITGKGMPIRGTKHFGDLMIEVHIEVPKDLKPEQIELIKKAMGVA
jgi:DnaJ-class molecular chaperone